MDSEPTSFRIPLTEVVLWLKKCGPDDGDALQTFLDAALDADYFVRRGHLQNLLKSADTEVYAGLIDGGLVAVAITYRHTTLHNLYVAAPFRGLGVGKAILKVLNVVAVRAKTNMSTGDPTAFYERAGFVHRGVDETKPHIGLMIKPPPEGGDLEPASNAAKQPDQAAADEATATAQRRAYRNAQKRAQRAKKRAQRETAETAARVALPEKNGAQDRSGRDAEPLIDLGPGGTSHLADRF